MKRSGQLLIAALAVLAVMSANPTGTLASTSKSQHIWESNQACVLPPTGALECFKSAAEMQTRSAQIKAQNPSVVCYVDLWNGINYTGSVLELWARGYWVNLADYGFDNAALSFQGTSCSFHLADYKWGGGYWYPGYTGPWAASADMRNRGWGWRASSFYQN